MKRRKRTLIVFARVPEPGYSKTRLIPVLGPQGASELHRRMCVHTLIHARGAARRSELGLEVHHTGGDAEAFFYFLGPDLTYVRQACGDLGQRMSHAFASAFARGDGAVVLIGTDCPGMDGTVLDRAFDELERNDVAIGPAHDGGYYLIGLSRPHPELFGGIRWGTDKALSDTLAAAAHAGLKVGRLPALSDVDRPEDLPTWNEVSSTPSSAPIHISVIIPTLNEADHLAATLAAVVAEPGVEVIVVDGGSGDATRDIAEAHGVRVVDAPRGRARQMNTGAAVARGSILLFLHADTMLPCGFASMLAEALSEKGVAGGAFRFQLDARSLALQIIEWGGNLRSRWLGLPYGDQAIFLPADTFHRLGGYPECPIMEDVIFVRRLRKRGRLRTLNRAATTSARRWQRLGAWRTSSLHAAALAAYACGFSPSQIHAWLTRRSYFGC